MIPTLRKIKHLYAQRLAALATVAMLSIGCTPDLSESADGDLAGKTEAFDDGVSRALGMIHPDLLAPSHRTFRSDLRAAQVNPARGFASSWWPMQANGIAFRWSALPADLDEGDLTSWSSLSALTDWRGHEADWSATERYDQLSYAEDRDVLAYCDGRMIGSDGKTIAIRRDAIARAVAGETIFCQTWPLAEWGRRGPTGWPTGRGIKRPLVTAIGPTTAWELGDHGIYRGQSAERWFGHCYGWAAYATGEPLGFPTRAITVRLDETGALRECPDPNQAGCVHFRRADIEALMTELYNSAQVSRVGERCNTADPKDNRYGRIREAACRDMNPGAFHIMLQGLIGIGVGEPRKTMPFAIDIDAEREVWSHPVIGYRIDEAEAVDQTTALRLIGKKHGKRYKFNRKAKRLIKVLGSFEYVSDELNLEHMRLSADVRTAYYRRQRLMAYILELDGNDQIVGGEWISHPLSTVPYGSKHDHPDFAWVVRELGAGVSSLTNPLLDRQRVRALLRCANAPESCAPPAQTTP
ncbi:MAG: hypothetical protein H6707_18260 [Deltaproteobacteria bacterium]|nr:hypothetical protein [Deltaproteobacteria bacterium]